jgi:hypothetical protein
VSTVQPPPAQPHVALAATQLAQVIARRTRRLEELLTRLVELHESDRRNWIASSTLAGQGNAGTAPTQLLKPNFKRRGLSVQNTAAAGSLTVGLGVTTPQSGAGIVLAPGSSWDGRISGTLWLGSVTVIASQAGVSYSWLEAGGPS